MFAVQQDGLCCKLSRPCEKIKPITGTLVPAQEDIIEVPRESLTFVKLLGSGMFGEVSRLLIGRFWLLVSCFDQSGCPLPT